MQRILVLRGGALGDFIVTLPALAALRARWPGARIELAGNSPAAQLAATRGLLDAVHSQHEARWAALYAASPLPADFAAWLTGFDLVLNYWPDPDGDLARHFPCTPAQHVISAEAYPTLAPAAAHYCEPLRQLGITVTAEDFCFRFPVPAMQGAIPHPPFSTHPRQIAIHPGSGSREKNWPLDRWLDVCRWLQATHEAELLIITGEAESSPTRQAFASLGSAAHNFPLEALVSALKSCRLFLGHDSGVSHLAAACGIPSVLLFGPTEPAMWAPPAPEITVIRHGRSLETIAVPEVCATTERFLSAQK